MQRADRVFGDEKLVWGIFCGILEILHGQLYFYQILMRMVSYLVILYAYLKLL